MDRKSNIKKCNVNTRVNPVISDDDRILALELGLAYVDDEFVTIRDVANKFGCTKQRTIKLIRKILYDVNKGLAEIVERKAVSRRPEFLEPPIYDRRAFHKIPADKATLKNARRVLTTLKKKKEAGTVKATKVNVRKAGTKTK